MASPYYPPRAGKRFAPRGVALAWDRAWFALARQLSRFGIRGASVGISNEQFVLALLLPGYAFLLLGRARLAMAMGAGWVAAAIVFIVAQPYPWVTGWTLGVLASTHTSGLGSLWLRQREIEQDPESLGLLPRLVIPLGLWISAFLLIYWPASGLFQRHIAYPLQFEGQTVIMNSWEGSTAVRNGQQVAFQMSAFNSGMVRVRGGIQIGTVLGRPGDRVEFEPEGARVHGRLYARMEGMPNSGSVGLAQGQWLIWPQLGVQVRGVDREQLERAFLQAARVKEGNLIGPAYHRWFFRQQNLP